MAKPDHPLVTKENFELIQWILDPKVIDGALRSAIHAHGPITLGNRTLKVQEVNAMGEIQVTEVTTCSTSSAAKRIRGAVKTRAAEYIQKKRVKPGPTWYTKIVRLVRPT